MAEIIKCPSCDKPLQIPESFFGQTVQCPECQHQFTAAPTSISSQPPPIGPSSPPPEKVPSKPRAYDDDVRDEEPPRRRDRYDEDDHDDFSRPSRIDRRLAPHRGGVIIALGIISMAVPCLGIVCGPIAWIMGNSDLAEIRAGRMDPAGEGLCQAGRILGIISTVLVLLILGFYCLIGIFAFGGNF